MFYLFDLDIDRMTLILTLDPDMFKMYLHTKNEAATYSSSNVMA